MGFVRLFCVCFSSVFFVKRWNRLGAIFCFCFCLVNKSEKSISNCVVSLSADPIKPTAQKIKHTGLSHCFFFWVFDSLVPIVAGMMCISTQRKRFLCWEKDKWFCNQKPSQNNQVFRVWNSPALSIYKNIISYCTSQSLIPKRVLVQIKSACSILCSPINIFCWLLPTKKKPRKKGINTSCLLWNTYKIRKKNVGDINFFYPKITGLYFIIRL